MDLCTIVRVYDVFFPFFILVYIIQGNWILASVCVCVKRGKDERVVLHICIILDGVKCVVFVAFFSYHFSFN